MENTHLKPGDVLLASCSQERYTILAVGKDDNGDDTIDLDVPDINEFINERWDDSSGLMVVEPRHVVFKGLRYRFPSFPADGTLVECNTPSGGCYSCTELFTVERGTDGSGGRGYDRRYV